MKLDPLFKLENNKLFTIDGKNVIPNFVDITSIDSENNLLENSFFRLLINQSQIETEPECYNEEYLAKLRDFLKVMEEKNQFVILNIIPGLKESDIQKIASGKSYDDKGRLFGENRLSPLAQLHDELVPYGGCLLPRVSTRNTADD